jgi:hypothetical protein
VDPAGSWPIAFHGLEIRWHPDTRCHHASDNAASIHTTRPDYSLTKQLPWQHSSVAHSSLPKYKKDGAYSSATEQANNGRGTPGVRSSTSKLESEEQHDRRRDEKGEADQIEIWDDLSNEGQGDARLGRALRDGNESDEGSGRSANG